MLKEFLSWRNGLEDGWRARGPPQIGLQRGVIDCLKCGNDPTRIEQIDLRQVWDYGTAVTHATELASVSRG